jgi:hypothetical protein
MDQRLFGGKGFTSFVTTYTNQRYQYPHDFLSKQFTQRKTSVPRSARFSCVSLLITNFALGTDLRLESIIPGFADILNRSPGSPRHCLASVSGRGMPQAESHA